MVVTRFCLVRHGETAWNAIGRIQGCTDIDLNDNGRWQASMVAQALTDAGITALYSSDLSRALNTAKIIGQQIGLQPQPLSQLRERNYGLFEGMTYESARLQYPEAYARYARRERHYDCETGESLEVLLDRISAAFMSILSAHRGESLVLVLHGAVLDIVYRFATGLPIEKKRDFNIPNAGINWLIHDGEAWRIEDWADTRHLASDSFDTLPT